MQGKKATKKIDLVLYVKILEFSEYAYKKLINLPKVVKYNSCNDFLLKLFECNILVSKLVKTGNDKKIEYSYKIQSNYKIMMVILKYMVGEKYITEDTYQKLQNYSEEISKLNFGYLEYLLGENYERKF